MLNVRFFENNDRRLDIITPSSAVMEKAKEAVLKKIRRIQ